MSSDIRIKQLLEIKRLVKSKRRKEFERWKYPHVSIIILGESIKYSGNEFYIGYMPITDFFHTAPILNVLGFLNVAIKHVKDGYHGKN